MTPASSKMMTVFIAAAIATAAFGQNNAPGRITIRNDIDLHYMEQGEGEPVIFVHGLTGDYSIWTRQVEGFAEEGFRAISYSRRYNFPNENAIQPDHSAISEAEDLAALIERLEIGQAHVIGHSYGAYTALMLALNHPERVRTVTLAEAPVVPWLKDLDGGRRANALAQQRRLMDNGFAPARLAFDKGDPPAAVRALLNTIGGDGTYEGLPDFVRERCLRNTGEMRALVNSSNPFPQVDRTKVSQLTIPTLLLSGSETVATARFTDPILEELLPKKTSRRIVLHGATHIMWAQQPVECRQAVIDFIRAQ